MGKRLLFLCVLIVLFSVPAFGSGFPDTYGFGVRAMSLGGAFTAVGDDYSAAYYNPAALAQRNVNRFSLDYIYTSPDIEVKTLNGQDLVTHFPDGQIRTDPVKYRGGSGLDLQVPVIGMELDPNVILGLPLNIQLGVAMSMPEQSDAMYRMYHFPPDQPHFLRYGNHISRITAAISMGAEVIKELVYVGAGVSPLLYGDGRMYMDGVTLSTDEDSKYVVAQAKVGSLLKMDPLAGILITPLDQRLKIGISWRHSQEVEIDPIPTIITTDDDFGELKLAMIMGMKSFFTPEEYSAGIAYEGEKYLISVEANRQLWSEYEYTGGEKFFYYPGAEGISGLETGSPAFDDTINLRVGGEYRFNDKSAVQLGYAHIPTPIPNQSGRVSNYIDMDKDLFSLGGTYAFDIKMFKAPVRVGAMIQYQMLDDYTVVKNNVHGPTWTDQESYKVEGDAYAGGVSVNIGW